MPNEPQSVEKPLTKECRRLRVSYHIKSDIVNIQHLSENGTVLSECHLDFDDAYDYAKSIFEVCDEALEVD